MKITDYALVFVGITLPFILIAYINIALTIRTFQQEMYYQKMIDAAVEDTMNQMKFVESDEITNSYGYSGEEDNKLSNNPKIAVDTFFKSMYGSLNIIDDKPSQSIIQLYVPVLAIMDYNGVYISSIEEKENGDFEHVLKPKRYFSFEFCVGYNNKVYIAQKDGWHEALYDESKQIWSIDSKNQVSFKENNIYVKHNIEFTTDDRIFDTLKIGKNTPVVNEYYMTDYTFTTNLRELVKKNAKNSTVTAKENDDTVTMEIYTENNTDTISPLFTGEFCTDHKQEEMFVEFLKRYKKELMTEIIVEELSYAANKNNEYARKKGISYNFSFSLDKNDTMYNDVENMGVLALVQGIKVGNRYLNYKAYNYSDLEVVHKYYLSTGEKNETGKININGETARFGHDLKLYHKTNECIEYLNDITFNDKDEIEYKSKIPEQEYTYTKEAAAMLGYMPCPICNP